MLSIKDWTITMTRGDTVRIDLTIKVRGTSEPYTPQEGDIIKFTVKADYADEEPLITKYIAIDEMVLELLPEDTKPLPFGRYVYDIELTTANGDVDTIIDKATLNIREEVG